MSRPIRVTVPAMSEDELRRQAEEFAKHRLGPPYRAYHPPNCKTRSGRYSSGAVTGWPDTTFLRAPRKVFSEFKGAGRVEISLTQIATLNELRGCGDETFLWRVGRVSLEEICNYLRPRVRPECPWSDPLIIGPWSVEGFRAAGFRIGER